MGSKVGLNVWRKNLLHLGKIEPLFLSFRAYCLVSTLCYLVCVVI